MKGLYYISIYSNANPPLVTGDTVRVFYDEIGDVFLVTKNGATITSGPNLGPSMELVVPPFGDPYFSTNWFMGAMNDNGDPDFSRPQYQFCELTTLVFFASSTLFPYVQKQTTPNHPSCAGNVCDIIFRGTPQVAQPTDTTTPDGQITIVAESSLGVVKYGFENVPYSSMPNTTGVFTGLLPGVYTIYAKDANNCTLTIVVNLSAAFNYAVRWRLQYMPVSKRYGDVVYPTRIDILEKDYNDVPVDVKSVDESFTLRMRGDNQPMFTTIMNTECSLALLSETNLQFLSAFTQNDRRFQLRYYKDFGSGFTELWRGWVKPGLYRETYTDSENYAVSLEATDGTANLAKLKFSDASGNPIAGLTRVIDIIATVLKKLAFDLPIHVADNLYESTMETTVSDDPTDQTWIIPDEVFDKDTTCDVVLQNLLGSKGARIVQWAKAWWIIRVDELVTDVVYRVFSKDGVLLSNATYSPVRPIADRPGDGDFTWINARQDLEVYPAVGVMTARHNLIKVPNGIKNGGFDKVNFTETTDVFGAKNFQITDYPGWSLILNGNTASYPFISAGASKDIISGTGENTTETKANAIANALALLKDGRITKSEYNTITARITKDDLPNYAIKIVSASNNATYGQDAYVISAPQPIVFSSKDGMKFGFDYFTSAMGSQVQSPFIKFKVSVKLDDQYYLQADGSWSTDSEFEWIEIVVPEGRYNEWSHIDIVALFPKVDNPVTTTYTVKLMGGTMSYNQTWIIGDETALRAFPTVTLPEGYKITTRQQSGSVITYRFYELFSDTLLADNSPEIIRPDDYGTFNPPAFNSLATYKKGDKVKNGSQFYVSTHDENKGKTPPFFPNDWVQFAGVVVWKLISEIQTGIAETPAYYGIKTVTANKFDNANMEFLPSGEVAPDVKDYTVTNDDDIDNDITHEFIIGDAPIDINNSKNIYQNIYRLANGDATIWWARREQAEKQPLLALLAKQYVEQLQRPRFKLAGDLSGYVNFIDSFLEKGRKFIPMSIEIRDFNNETSIEMIELTPAGGNNGFNLGEFDNNEFGTDFDI